MNDVYVAMMMGCGVLWLGTYLLIIRRGFLDRTYGMPVGALCANIAWEVIFAFVVPHPAPYVYVNYLWFAFDLVIVYQFLRFGRREFPRLRPLAFFGNAAAGTILAFGIILVTTREFHDPEGAYAAFSQNLIMSLLFVSMLYSRDSVRGQSLYIAIGKCAGTLLPCLAFYLYKPISQGSELLPLLYLAILFYDLLYIVLVFRACKREGIDPWRRL